MKYSRHCRSKSHFSEDDKQERNVADVSSKRVFIKLIVVKGRSDILHKKISLPSCFQYGCHPSLQLMCTLNPDCFNRLSSKFVQS